MRDANCKNEKPPQIPRRVCQRIPGEILANQILGFAAAPLVKHLLAVVRGPLRPLIRELPEIRSLGVHRQILRDRGICLSIRLVQRARASPKHDSSRRHPGCSYTNISGTFQNSATFDDEGEGRTDTKSSIEIFRVHSQTAAHRKFPSCPPAAHPSLPPKSRST